MELKSFREILLKKAEGDPYLETLIEYSRDDLLIEKVLESLKKMAEPTAALGSRANTSLTHYAGSLNDIDVDQLRDALGHHVSHYKSALKAHHAAADPAQKTKLRSVADQHLNKIIPMMHLAGRVGKHSNGKLALDYVSTTPWESNYTTTRRHEHNGKLLEGTKDLGRRPVKNSNARERNDKAVHNYHYLEMPPHPGHERTKNMPHKGGYPFEEVRLGSPAEVSAGRGYLPIEDIKDKQNYTPHPFDEHPIHSVADMAEHHLTPEQREQFKSAVASWESHPAYEKWLADQEVKANANPEAYEKSGHVKPGHHYEGVPLQAHPKHVAESVAAMPTASPTAPAQAQGSKPSLRSPPPSSEESELDPVTKDIIRIYKEASPKNRKIMRDDPAWKKYLKHFEGVK